MVLPALGPARAFFVSALLVSAAALVFDYASLRWFGPAGAFVHVRWAPEVADTAEGVIVADAAAQQHSRRTAATAVLPWAGAAVLAVLALVVGAAPTHVDRLTRAVRAAAAAVGCGAYGRTPELSPEDAALFQIVFGGAAATVFAPSPPLLFGDVIGPWL